MDHVQQCHGFNLYICGSRKKPSPSSKFLIDLLTTMMNDHSCKLPLLIALVLTSIVASHAHENRQVYVVYLGGQHRGKTTAQEEIEHIHHLYLQSVKGSLEEAKSSIVYSYSKVINGFSAFLTPEEAKKISEMDGVTSVFKDKAGKIQTSRSWDFLSLLEADGNPAQADGLDKLLQKANFGMDIIVGVLDTGIWPESQSFADDGMDPIPTSWRGICQTGEQFNESHCNKKIVGARYYVNGYEAVFGPLESWMDYRSPRDRGGHGTHVSSTVGGRRVANVSTDGIQMGTIRGGAPLVRLAVYKVCWGFGDCFDSDVLAAIDDAINDGVDVVSASIVFGPRIPYTEDPLVIGALHAAEHNIVSVLAAGNFGPSQGTVSNSAPWAITVGASTIDRVFTSPLLLTDSFDQQYGVQLQAMVQSISPFTIMPFTLVYARDIEIPGSTTPETTGKCLSNTLQTQKWLLVAVLCLEAGLEQVREVGRAGGFSAVMRNDSNEGIGELTVVSPVFPAIAEPYEADVILKHIRTIESPFAIFNQTRPLTGTKAAPYAPIMAWFSSRGPSQVQPNILKPDVIAPGQYIVAASTNQMFRESSGTSMATPHVAAVAALLKAIHPTWSEAVIRSAIMTTAKVTNNVGGNIIINNQLHLATSFDYGSGHIQPSKAADPGLVYDASYNDYIQFLCSTINDTLGPLPCPTSHVHAVTDLNYPSVAVANVQGSVALTRSLTNVGTSEVVTYAVLINHPPGYRVQITPEKLHFSRTRKTQSFSILVEPLGDAERSLHAFGSYTWSDGVHQVRSPIALIAGNSILTAPDAELRATT